MLTPSPYKAILHYTKNMQSGVFAGQAISRKLPFATLSDAQRWLDAALRDDYCTDCGTGSKWTISNYRIECP